MQLTVVRRTSVSLKRSAAHIFLQEIVRDPTAISRIMLSSQRLVFRGLPLVMVKSKILKSSNRLMNSRFATGHFFANLPLSKHFLCKITIWALLVLDKLTFFCPFFDSQNL